MTEPVAGPPEPLQKYWVKRLFGALHAAGGAGGALGHDAVDHVEALLAFVEAHLVVGGAAAGEVGGAPLDVEDAVGRRAGDGGEDAHAGADIGALVVPVGEDGVVVGAEVGGRGETGVDVAARLVDGQELQLAVGGGVGRGEALPVERVGERQGNRVSQSSQALPVLVVPGTIVAVPGEVW